MFPVVSGGLFARHVLDAPATGAMSEASVRVFLLLVRPGGLSNVVPAILEAVRGIIVVGPTGMMLFVRYPLDAVASEGFYGHATVVVLGAMSARLFARHPVDAAAS